MIKRYNNIVNEGLRDKMTNPISEQDIYDIIDKHDERKEKIKELLKEILKEYDEFSKTISPKEWRVSSTYYMKMKNLLENIDDFNKITIDEFVKSASYM